MEFSVYGNPEASFCSAYRPDHDQEGRRAVRRGPR